MILEVLPSPEPRTHTAVGPVLATSPRPLEAWLLSLGTSQEAFSVLIKVLLGGGLAVSLALPGRGGAMKLGRVSVVLAVVHRH